MTNATERGYMSLSHVKCYRALIYFASAWAPLCLCERCVDRLSHANCYRTEQTFELRGSQKQKKEPQPFKREIQLYQLPSALCRLFRRPDSHREQGARGFKSFTSDSGIVGSGPWPDPSTIRTIRCRDSAPSGCLVKLHLGVGSGASLGWLV